MAQTLRILASLVLESKKLQGVPLAGEDNINHKPWSTTFSHTDILSLIHLSGDEDQYVINRGITLTWRSPEVE